MTLSKNIFIIGLTGGSGSGKTTIAKYLTSFGASVIDCDAIAHNIIKKGEIAYFEILKKISFNILDEDEEINRKKLGSIVFNDISKLKTLNSITHSHIKEEVFNQIKQIEQIELNEGAYKYIIIDAPLLIEANLHVLCNEVWVCYARREIQIERIMKRDNLSYEAAVKRINLQMPFKELKKYAHFCIDTSKGTSTAYAKGLRLLRMRHKLS